MRIANWFVDMQWELGLSDGFICECTYFFHFGLWGLWLGQWVIGWLISWQLVIDGTSNVDF